MIAADPSPERAKASSDTSRGNVARTIVASLATRGSVGRQVEFVDGDTPIGDVFRG